MVVVIFIRITVYNCVFVLTDTRLLVLQLSRSLQSKSCLNRPPIKSMSDWQWLNSSLTPIEVKTVKSNWILRKNSRPVS